MLLHSSTEAVVLAARLGQISRVLRMGFGV